MPKPLRREPDRAVDTSDAVDRAELFSAPPPTDVDTPDGLAFEREGLPSDYRMRSEEHYVDQLLDPGDMPQFRRVRIEEIDSGLAAADDDLESLADSIRAHGVLQPLLARRFHGRYELLAGTRRLAAAVRAGLTEVPCLVHDVNDIEAARLADAVRHRTGDAQARAERSWAQWSRDAASSVEASLASILSTLALFERPDAPLRDRVAISLIRAEANKTTRLLRGLEALREPATLAIGPTDAAAISRSVLAETEDERGLLSVTLVASLPDSCPMVADETVLRAALSGAVETILALLSTGRPTELFVELSIADAGGEVQLSVAEHAVPVRTSSPSRWFDPSWTERAGGFAAAVSLLSAKRGAELHGGRVQIVATETHGCRLTMTLPSQST